MTTTEQPKITINPTPNRPSYQAKDNWVKKQVEQLRRELPNSDEVLIAQLVVQRYDTQMTILDHNNFAARLNKSIPDYIGYVEGDKELFQ